jgi:hypothetical protein
MKRTRKTGMMELQWTDVGNDAPNLSEQFDEWFMTESRDYPDIRIKHMQVLYSTNRSKQHVETMYLIYEYDIA